MMVLKQKQAMCMHMFLFSHLFLDQIIWLDGLCYTLVLQLEWQWKSQDEQWWMVPQMNTSMHAFILLVLVNNSIEHNYLRFLWVDALSYVAGNFVNINGECN